MCYYDQTQWELENGGFVNNIQLPLYNLNMLKDSSAISTTVQKVSTCNSPVGDGGDKPSPSKNLQCLTHLAREMSTHAHGIQSD